jgi:hypothetical protein
MKKYEEKKEKRITDLNKNHLSNRKRKETTSRTAA